MPRSQAAVETAATQHNGSYLSRIHSGKRKYINVIAKRKAGRLILTVHVCDIAERRRSRFHCIWAHYVYSSPDSDDTMPGDESEEYGRDDTFLVSDRSENKFYGKFLHLTFLLLTK